MSHPFVSVIMPVRNELSFIKQSLETVFAQDYPRHKMEILITDGMSSDGTQDIIKRFIMDHRDIEMSLLENRDRIVSTGLNQCIRASKGGVIIRMDAHSEYPADYISKSVEYLNKNSNELGTLFKELLIGVTNFFRDPRCFYRN